MKQWIDNTAKTAARLEIDEARVLGPVSLATGPIRVDICESSGD